MLDGEPDLYFEINTVHNDVANGAIIVDGMKAGIIQFDLNRLCKKAIRRFRKKGVPVKFLPHTKLTAKRR